MKVLLDSGLYSENFNLGPRGHLFWSPYFIDEKIVAQGGEMVPLTPRVGFISAALLLAACFTLLASIY